MGAVGSCSRPCSLAYAPGSPGGGILLGFFRGPSHRWELETIFLAQLGVQGSPQGAWTLRSRRLGSGSWAPSSRLPPRWCLHVPCGLARPQGCDGRSDHLAPAPAQGKQGPDCPPGPLRAHSASTWMARVRLGAGRGRQPWPRRSCLGEEAWSFPRGLDVVRGPALASSVGGVVPILKGRPGCK